MIEFYEAHIDLGGPVVRDKAWFYAAYNRFVIDRIISGVPEDVATDLGDFDMFTVKANWQITDRDQFITFHHWSLKQKPFRSLSRTIPAESILAQDSWSWLHKAEWQRVWSDRLYSNIQVNHFGFGWPMTPAVDPATKPPRLDEGTGERAGAGWRPFTFNRWKPHTTRVSSNYYLPTETGSHDLKFGWDFQIDERQFGWNANSGAVRYLDNSAQDPPRPHNVNEIHFNSFPNLNYDRNTHMDFYVQDVWTLNDRLTVNAGVRFGSQRIGYLDSNNVPGGPCDATLGCLREIADVDANVAAALPLLFGQGGAVPGDRQRDELVERGAAPRLHLRPDRRGARSVLKGYWGRYYWNMNSGWQSSNPGGNKSVDYEFLDQNMNGLFDGVHELGERLGGSTGAGLGIERTGSVGAEIDPNIWQPYVDEVSVSAEHQVGNDLGARLSVVHKRQTGAYGEPVNIARIGTLTNSQTIACPAACDTPPASAARGSRLTVLPDGATTSQNLITNWPDELAAYNWTTVSMGVNRRFRNNFFWNAYFDYQWRHEGPEPQQQEQQPVDDGPDRRRPELPVRVHPADPGPEQLAVQGGWPLRASLRRWSGRHPAFGQRLQLGPQTVGGRAERRDADHLPRQPGPAPVGQRPDSGLPDRQGRIARRYRGDRDHVRPVQRTEQRVGDELHHARRRRLPRNDRVDPGPHRRPERPS